ncbi:uncharacterized protein LOC131848360 [Achroia grisella]|uniref:uncharacterized protein LOC131848360 n=1 Tax=Achroia grisella TaxID=688607 RepID=UPI0027D2BB55|nr:uncharacterized protein LOC131848360 [Achroia grisella]
MNQSESARTRPNSNSDVDTTENAIELIINDQNVDQNDIRTISLLSDMDKSNTLELSKDCYVQVIKSMDGDVVADADGDSQQYSFINVDPNIKNCTEHSDMYLHKDETLIKPGDMFDTHESFRLYVNGFAEQWLYYYTCADSHTQDPSKEYYTYRCVFCKPKCDYRPKGMRKRSETLKTSCPCKIVLKRLPYNPDVLTVEFVCDHHNHELSNENFLKLQHGKRLHPQVKEEIMDLLYLDVEPKILKKYIQELTGFNLNLNYFVHIARKMKKNNEERTFTPEQFDELTKKVKDLRFIYGNIKDDTVNKKPQRGRRKRKGDDSVNIANSEDINHDDEFGTPYSSDKKLKKDIEYEDIDTKSRLETCLQRLSYDEETLESVKRLQSSVQCETQRNPWISEDICPAPSNGSSYMSDSMGTSQNEEQLEMSNATNTFQAEHMDESYIQNMSEQNVEVSEINNSADHIVTENYVLANNDENAHEVYVLENSGSETYVLENNEHNAVNYVLTSNGQNVPQSYVLENGIVVTYNAEGQGFTESEVVYDNDHTAVANDQEANSNSYVLVDDSTGLIENTVGQNTELQANDSTEFQVDESTILDGKEYMDSHDNDSQLLNESDASIHSDYEYIHRFNIDQYMTQPWFLRYIQTVAEDTKMKAVDMLSNLYLGKTMFKLITTRKVDMQTIRIKYLVENVPSLTGFDCNDRVKYKLEAAKYCKKLMSLKKKLLYKSRYIHSLKGTVDSLKKANSALTSRNKHMDRVKSQNVLHNYKKDLQHLRETKESLLSQISDSEHQIAHLNEVKRNLKKDICKFISKKVMLQKLTGENTEKIENVKDTLAKAIETSKNLKVDSDTSSKQANVEEYILGNVEGLQNIVLQAVENVPEGINIEGQYNDGDIVYVVQGDQDENALQNIS